MGNFNESAASHCTYDAQEVMQAGSVLQLFAVSRERTSISAAGLWQVMVRSDPEFLLNSAPATG